MNYDAEAIKVLMPDHSRVRVYEWPAPGITYGWKQTVPSEWRGWDSAVRPTGGGLVFHCPGDIVFSVCDWRQPGFRSKDLLLKLTQYISQILIQMGIQSKIGHELPSVNHTYCKTYPTPFELSVGQDKVLGLTMRLFRDRYLVQGIVHIAATRLWFGDVTSGEPFFNEGLFLSNPQKKDLIRLLKQSFSK